VLELFSEWLLSCPINVMPIKEKTTKIKVFIRLKFWMINSFNSLYVVQTLSIVRANSA
jgi:hypothetical protein